MNKILITGNLTRDIELTHSQGGMAMLSNSVACKRKIKDKNTGNYESDFIPIKAFGKTAEHIANYFGKGQGIQVEGRMQSGNYTNNDGKKVYTLELFVENVEFMGGKKENNNNSSYSNEYSAPANDTFGGGNFEEDITPVDDGDMPF